MRPQERRRLISRRLNASGAISFTGLAQELAVSEMTVRRDLKLLEGEGQARGVRGGAIPVVSRSYEPPFAHRQVSAAAAKVAIGRAATLQINDGDTVILDVGTTTVELARALRGRQKLTIVTASLPIAVELGNEPEMRVIVAGGLLRTGELSLTGGATEEAFTDVNCDVVFLGVAGLDEAAGLTDFNPDDARVKRAAMRSARRAIVLADRTKLGRVTFSRIAPLTAVDMLITDGPTSDPTVIAARGAGVDVVHVAVAAPDQAAS